MVPGPKVPAIPGGIGLHIDKALVHDANRLMEMWKGADKTKEGEPGVTSLLMAAAVTAKQVEDARMEQEQKKQKRKEQKRKEQEWKERERKEQERKEEEQKEEDRKDQERKDQERERNHCLRIVILYTIWNAKGLPWKARGAAICRFVGSG